MYDYVYEHERKKVLAEPWLSFHLLLLLPLLLIVLIFLVLCIIEQGSIYGMHTWVMGEFRLSIRYWRKEGPRGGRPGGRGEGREIIKMPFHVHNYHYAKKNNHKVSNRRSLFSPSLTALTEPCKDIFLILISRRTPDTYDTRYLVYHSGHHSPTHSVYTRIICTRNLSKNIFFAFHHGSINNKIIHLKKVKFNPCFPILPAEKKTLVNLEKNKGVNIYKKLGGYLQSIKSKVKS